MIEDFEVLDYNSFYKKAVVQLRGLREKYAITGGKNYLEAIKELKKVVRHATKLKEYCVPFINSDNQLGYIEFSSKKERDEFYRDYLKETINNFV